MIYNVTKSPSADLDYSLDWTAWLDGDTIAESTWTVPAASLITLHDDSASTHKTTVWMASGKAGSPHLVVNRIVTTAGRIEERTISVSVQQR